MRYLINVSNHSSRNFLKLQRKFNENNFDEVIDIIPPSFTEDSDEGYYADQVDSIFKRISHEILIRNLDPKVDFKIMVVGEFGFTFSLVDRLLVWQNEVVGKINFVVVYPFSKRILETEGNATPIRRYAFHNYREYKRR